MAKKVRTPAPPRRPVQAPKRRESPRPSTAGTRPPAILYVPAIAGIVMLGAVLLFLWLRGRENIDVAGAMSAAGCTYRELPDLGRQHVNNLNAKPKWNSFPPTSGGHYNNPAIFDLYEAPLNQLLVVHNLEHGGVAIQYGSRVPPASVEQIQTFYREDPNGMIVAPLPRLGDKIALTSWRHIATCSDFDETAFSAFRDGRRYKGPEAFPTDSLNPGS